MIKHLNLTLISLSHNGVLFFLPLHVCNIPLRLSSRLLESQIICKDKKNYRNKDSTYSYTTTLDRATDVALVDAGAYPQPGNFLIT